MFPRFQPPGPHDCSTAIRRCRGLPALHAGLRVLRRLFDLKNGFWKDPRFLLLFWNASRLPTRCLLAPAAEDSGDGAFLYACTLSWLGTLKRRAIQQLRLLRGCPENDGEVPGAAAPVAAAELNGLPPLMQFLNDMVLGAAQRCQTPVPGYLVWSTRPSSLVSAAKVLRALPTSRSARRVAATPERALRPVPVHLSLSRRFPSLFFFHFFSHPLFDQYLVVRVVRIGFGHVRG